ncbi:MAG: TIM barrel protein [Planctomycetota bacterium]
MIYPGLVSVTFRQLAPAEIVGLVVQAGLLGIEWGGDIHVTHGDFKRAREVNKITTDAGLKVFAYGSYYRVGESEAALPFEKVLETAVSLKAPLIRVWAGSSSSVDAGPAYRNRVVSDTLRIAAMASEANIIISYEFHKGSLTDTYESAMKLMEEVGHDNVRLYWQTPLTTDAEENLAGLDRILPWATNTHVFNWSRATESFQPLEQVCNIWHRYLQKFAASNHDHAAMLEFVKDNSPDMFLEDAKTLRKLLKEI